MDAVYHLWFYREPLTEHALRVIFLLEYFQLGKTGPVDSSVRLVAKGEVGIATYLVSTSSFRLWQQKLTWGHFWDYRSLSKEP